MTDSARTTRRLTSWIDGFVEYLDAVDSPHQFKLWCAISTIAGALERRVSVDVGRGPLWPNMYVLLVSQPGVGKGLALGRAASFWAEVPELNIAPTTLSKAGLLDEIQDAGKVTRNRQGREYVYHSLLFCSVEFGNFVSSWDAAFMNILNEVYDSTEVPLRERLRSRSREEQINIVHPQLHILAGTGPNYLSSLLPMTAWGTGFPSRCMLVYSGEAELQPLFRKVPNDQALRASLVHDFRQISKLEGEFVFEKEAAEMLNSWYMERFTPAPFHPKLQHYVTRRLAHFSKLLMAVSVSRSNELVIRVEDFTLARAILLATEAQMPEIFKAMTYSDDQSILQDLYNFVLAQHIKTGEGCTDGLIYTFLMSKVPSHKVREFLTLAAQARIIEKDLKGKWIPCDKMEHLF